jgi:hypothetical protein
MAARQPGDLREREALVEPLLELVAIHERILPVRSDGKANMCSPRLWLYKAVTGL